MHWQADENLLTKKSKRKRRTNLEETYKNKYCVDVLYVFLTVLCIFCLVLYLFCFPAFLKEKFHSL